MNRDLDRRTLLGTGAAAMGAQGLAMRPGMAQAQTSVSLQLSWLHSTQFAGSYIAQDRGFWSDAGLDVALLSGGPNAPVEPPVVAGTALVGISAADYTAAAVEQGAPFRIIGVAMQKNPFVIASLPENPVDMPADLVGKRIGMALANMPVLQALCTLNDVDIDASTSCPRNTRRSRFWPARSTACCAGKPTCPSPWRCRASKADHADGRSRLFGAFADLYRHR